MSVGIASKTPDAVWWDVVSGPSRLVYETVSILSDGKSVCLCADCRIPYHDTFFEQVANELRGNEPEMVLGDTFDTGEEPGKFLVDKLGLRAEHGDIKTIAKLIKENRTWTNHLIPVVSNCIAAQGWHKFIRTYNSRSPENGLFVLETVDFTPDPAISSERICTLKYSDFVSEYDSMLFAGLLANREAAKPGTERYITALAVSLLGTDAERIADFVQDYIIDSDPIEHIGGCDDRTLARKVWNAQSQELFPLIMRETREFIDTWREQIDETFEYIKASRSYNGSLFSNGLRNMVGEEIRVPEEMELATIWFLMRKKRQDEYGNETSEYVLYIPDDTVRARMKLLYDSRNKIAHGKICDAGEVTQLLCNEKI